MGWGFDNDVSVVVDATQFAAKLNPIKGDVLDSQLNVGGRGHFGHPPGIKERAP